MRNEVVKGRELILPELLQNSSRRLRRLAKRGKEVFAGTLRTPAEGGGPLHSRYLVLFPILQQP